MSSDRGSSRAAPLLRLEAVSKVYSRPPVEIHALERVDLEIHPGELVAVAGPSGCGKSTLLGLMGLLDLPSEGEVWLHGQATSALSAVERARLRRESIGFVFHERTGLGHRASHYPAELSGGQQQSAAIARATVGAPALLLADEPTGNLDSESGSSVMQLLLALNGEGTALCFVTHDPRYAQLARRRIDLFDGRIVGDHRRRVA